MGQQGRSHWLLKGPGGSGIKPRENMVGRRAGRAQRAERVTPDHLQFKHIVQQPCLGWQQGPSLACFPHNTSLFCTPPFLERALLQETWPWAAYVGTQVLNSKPSRREPSRLCENEVGVLRQGATHPAEAGRPLVGIFSRGHCPEGRLLVLGLAEASSNLRFCGLTTQLSWTPTMSQGQKRNPCGQSAYCVPTTGLPVNDLTYCHNKPVRKESSLHQREGKQAGQSRNSLCLPALGFPSNSIGVG